VPITTFSPHADAPRTAARQIMIESGRPADLEMLITKFEQRAHPLDRDVVITSDVAEYVCKHSVAKPSNVRIGMLLGGPPFNAARRKWKIDNAEYRGMVLRNQAKWLAASGTDIMAHINGETGVDLSS
jgi:hypothetical protein